MDQNNNANPVQIHRYLGGVDYPASKQELVETARDQGADESVISMIERLPDKRYASPTDVTEEIGNM